MSQVLLFYCHCQPIWQFVCLFVWKWILSGFRGCGVLKLKSFHKRVNSRRHTKINYFRFILKHFPRKANCTFHFFINTFLSFTSRFYSGLRIAHIRKKNTTIFGTYWEWLGSAYRLPTVVQIPWLFISSVELFGNILIGKRNFWNGVYTVHATTEDVYFLDRI